LITAQQTRPQQAAPSVPAPPVPQDIAPRSQQKEWIKDVAGKLAEALDVNKDKAMKWLTDLWNQPAPQPAPKQPDAVQVQPVAPQTAPTPTPDAPRQPPLASKQQPVASFTWELKNKNTPKSFNDVLATASRKELDAEYRITIPDDVLAETIKRASGNTLKLLQEESAIRADRRKWGNNKDFARHLQTLSDDEFGKLYNKVDGWTEKPGGVGSNRYVQGGQWEGSQGRAHRNEIRGVLRAEGLRRYGQNIRNEARKLGLDEAMALALFYHESSFNPHARNPESTASGLGQIVHETAEGLKEQGGIHDFKDVYNPQKTIKVVLSQRKIETEKVSRLLRRQADEQTIRILGFVSHHSGWDEMKPAIKKALAASADKKLITVDEVLDKLAKYRADTKEFSRLIIIKSKKFMSRK
jgi:hypothetical protein